MSEHSRANILVVDDTETNIDILVDVLAPEYEVAVAMDGATALEMAEEEPPDLILLDIMMPDMDGYEVCRRLKAARTTYRIPVIFVTALSDTQDEAAGFAAGGVDYITKPISPPIVLARVATHLALADQQRACEHTVERQLAEIRQSHKDAVYMLGHAGHYNDDDTGVHIWRMASYARELAKSLGWSVEAQQLLLLAAPLHDTGKIGMPDSILKKPGPLTEEEWVIMRTHTTIGHRILSVSNTPLFVMAADVALCHHERWGGGGYPAGLQGEAIPEAARIVAITDVFDALTMQRPYKQPWPVERALEYIAQGDGHFDPHMVEHFLYIQDRIVEIMRHWNRKEKGNFL
ncbi:response regulator [Desulfovibrio psychrotolerans]|uniref:Two-component system response regulator n=1 Tax=Desulfovibrio psychrotolerans TaxID=415242 RepID=A0A7J0BXM5_9BACT|nr:HD domain-containing phosphohydrolase [Desulfovibrio psychrotolerans]GFM38450.1 two-component system response regulator [Desulfovibrio psychrotolerans]